jgi:GNAT superfamily N-acetyltransferase
MLPLGWHTDLAVLRLDGSAIEDHGDHLVVRSPENPTFHWGNFVLVTDPKSVDDAERWTATFEEAFPDAPHRAIGLVVEPAAEPWEAAGLAVEREDVLSADRRPEPTPLAAGHLVRELGTQEDWAQSTGLEVREYPGDATFHHAATASRAAMSARGQAAWFGAFEGDRLVAQLGIVDCGGGLARYQAVLTSTEHRRRGLASHLLGVAAQWAAERGAQQWVIVAEESGDPSRLYRSRGFEPADKGFRALRRPGGSR